jgi:hypothetical protein
MEHFFEKIPGWFDFEDVYRRMVEIAGPVARFVEVGAFQGKSTCFMGVEICNSRKHILFDVVDTWEGSVEHLAGGVHESADVMTHSLFQAFRQNTKPIAHLINPIRLPSLEAAKKYEERSLDFVFIDAAHDYENVRADILAWRSKVKVGGHLGGHDFILNFPGVIQAVNELVPNASIIGTSWLTQIT